MYYKIILFFIILLVINFLLRKFKFLIDNPDESFHKIEKKPGTPLSGGIYLFFSLILLSILSLEVLFKLNIFIFLLLILILGVLSDIKKNFTPKLRIVCQLFIILCLVFINQEILIYRTTIDFLDLIIQNQVNSFLFTVFCIITLLNGFNFMDGVNGLVSGYILLILLTLNLILIKTSNQLYLNDILLVFFVFYISNFFGKSFLGDNGIYVSSILISYLLLSMLNFNKEISPLIAVSLLWYPAIENLFTILRRLIRKKPTFLPDKLHLHTLIFSHVELTFKNIPSNYKNSLTGFILILILIPNFICTYLFYNKSIYLASLVILYIFIYLISYILLSKNKSKM